MLNNNIIKHIIEQKFGYEVNYIMISTSNAYTQRSPRKSQYYKCVESHFEELENTWEDKYKNTYGYWRNHITDVIYKYLDCGDLHCGFARVKCKECNKEYLLPFSCKRRHFCPSCHQKRVIEFGEYLFEEVLKEVPHRQWVFSIPKRIRPFFMYDRKLLSKLSKCAWNVLSTYLKKTVNDENSKPAVVIAVQTFGDFLNFNPHLHVIAADGCFDTDGNFVTGNIPNADDLEEIFRYEVLKMLKKEGKIFDITIENMKTWHHSGFNIYCGPAIFHDDEEGIINLARYIIRAPISQERMYYIPITETMNGIAKVIYKSKTSNQKETFTALDFLARLVTHIPNRGEQLVRYYGYYSNKSRGLRKKADKDRVSGLIETKISKKKFNRNWARLIQKIYNVDPLLCPECSGEMRIISFIEDKKTIKKILKHLNLWLPDNKSPPKNNINNTSAASDFDCGSQIEYEEDYSQINPYEDF